MQEKEILDLYEKIKKIVYTHYKGYKSKFPQIDLEDLIHDCILWILERNKQPSVRLKKFVGCRIIDSLRISTKYKSRKKIKLQPIYDKDNNPIEIPYTLTPENVMIISDRLMCDIREYEKLLKYAQDELDVEILKQYYLNRIPLKTISIMLGKNSSFALYRLNRMKKKASS